MDEEATKDAIECVAIPEDVGKGLQPCSDDWECCSLGPAVDDLEPTAVVVAVVWNAPSVSPSAGSGAPSACEICGERWGRDEDPLRGSGCVGGC